MKIFSVILQVLWRIWFALIVFIGVLIFAPFFWLFLLNRKWYTTFHSICKMWSKFILHCSGFYLEVEFEEELDKTKPYIICPNHASYLDIPATFALFPGVFVFIGKKSLSKIPIFGWIYKKTMILVDRSSNRSSYMAYQQASERIKEGTGIAIYPEGGIPPFETKLQKFKAGAFRMAIEQGVPIVPITFGDNKRRFPSGVMAGCPGKLRVFVHKPISSEVYDMTSVNDYKKEVYDLIDNKLSDYESRR